MGINTKQVIVIRKDLNMRKGKMISQGAHAAMSFLTRDEDWQSDYAVQEWLGGSFRKICVYVESENDLNVIYTKAKALKLRTHMIEDNGTTEFGGVPTKTCLAIGPDYDEKIDLVTGDLPLL